MSACDTSTPDEEPTPQPALVTVPYGFTIFLADPATDQAIEGGVRVASEAGFPPTPHTGWHTVPTAGLSLSGSGTAPRDDSAHVLHAFVVDAVQCVSGFDHIVSTDVHLRTTLGAPHAEARVPCER